MWRLWHKLFGWDYVVYAGSFHTRVCQLYKDGMGRVWIYRHTNSDPLTIDDPKRVMWLTCSPAKWGF